jgi:hypothetical protein
MTVTRQLDNDVDIRVRISKQNGELYFRVKILYNGIGIMTRNTPVDEGIDAAVRKCRNELESNRESIEQELLGENLNECDEMEIEKVSQSAEIVGKMQERGL